MKFYVGQHRTGARANVRYVKLEVAPGHWQRRDLGRVSKSVAMQAAAGYAAQVDAGVYRAPRDTTVSSIIAGRPLTLGALFSRWSKSKRVKESTKQSMLSQLAPFEEVAGDIPCSLLTRARLAEIAEQVAAMKRSDGKPRLGPATYARALATVRSVFLFADRMELDGVPRLLAPALALKSEKAGRVSEKEYLTETERTALLSACTTESTCIRTGIEMLFELGLRHGELLGLEWRDLDLGSAPSIRIERQRHGEQLKTESSRRTCPISLSLARLLREWRVASPCSRDEDPVFADTRGRHMGRQWPAMEQALRAAATRAGITKHVTPHTARHTVASLLQAAGHPILFVSRFLGHANPTMTLSRYSHSNPDDLRTLVSNPNPKGDVTQSGTNGGQNRGQ